MALSEQRQGEIALLYLKNKMRKEGIRVGFNTIREIHSTAKEIGIEPVEAMEFAEGLVRAVVEETFKKQ